MNNCGFTLVELLITLALLAILIAIGGPSLTHQIQHNKVKTTTLSLLEAVELTRTQAVAANTRTTLKVRDLWQNGWDIFIDSNSNGSWEEGEKLLASNGKINGVRITANQPIKHYISYLGTGESRMESKINMGAFQAGSLTVCPEQTGGGYKLTLSRGGRMRMQEIDAEQCAQH